MTWAGVAIPYPRSRGTQERGERCHPQEETPLGRWLMAKRRGAQTSVQGLPLTTRSSSGWPVASSHALLASSRTPSRSAPVMASPSGRSEAGLLLVRDGRSPPSRLPTSEHSLSPGLGAVLPTEHCPLPERGEGALLAWSQQNSGTGCEGSL